MSRQPIVSGDENSWGAILNDYLSQSLNTSGGITTSLLATFSGGNITLSAAGLLTILGTTGTGIQFANGAVIQDDGINQLTIKGGSSGVRILDSSGATNLFNFANTGILTLSQYGSGGGAVSVGAADSGGLGFKLLRVPN